VGCCCTADPSKADCGTRATGPWALQIKWQLARQSQVVDWAGHASEKLCAGFPWGRAAGFHEPVPKAVLKEARRVSKFAVGAYGLQSIVWGKGK
jgi:hypothetical protein